MRSEKLQFSIANLLGWVGVFAILIALAKIDFLWVPIDCPFLLGPMTAITVTPTRWSVILGTLWSLCWLFISLVPYWLLAAFLIWATQTLNDGSMTRRVLVAITVTYFLLVSAIGGYRGGVAARPD